MKKLLSTTAVVAISMLAWGAPAQAFVATDASFFTAPSNGTLTFTFEGFSAGDTDVMNFTSMVFLFSRTKLRCPARL